MKLKIFIAVAAALVLAGGVSAAQAAHVRNVVNITNDDNGDNELDIAINPTNSANMVAGWNDYGVGGSCGVGWTTDGGKTWHTDWLRGMTPDGGNPTYDYGAGDPSVGFLDDGTAVFTCNAWSIKKPTAIYVTTSNDGGATWAPVQQVASADTKAGNLDHPMMTIDHYGHRALLAYTTWSGHQANSWALVSDPNNATHWSGPYRIAADYKSNAPDVFDVSLAGAPDGTIYATSGIWQHVNEWNEQAVVVSQLRRGETAFTRSVKVRDLAPMPMTLPGESWRTSMQASIGVDKNGVVYELTGDYVTGHAHMYLAKSTDHGQSFSTLQLTSGNHDEVMPWMSVTTNGRVDTIFYDYDESTGLMDVDYGQVAAGGSTLSRTVVQSGIDGDSQPPRGAGGTPFMGDYLGIDSTAGLVALAWTGNGPFSQDAWAATLQP